MNAYTHCYFGFPSQNATSAVNCVDAYHKMSDGPPGGYQNMEARTGEIVPRVCTPPGWKPRSPKALNDLGFSSKAILLSSASLANVRHGMDETQGQCFAGKRRVNIPLWSWIV